MEKKFSFSDIKPSERYITKRYAAITFTIKNLGGRKFTNFLVRFKGNHVEFSDREDFMVLWYIPYNELEAVEGIEDE